VANKSTFTCHVWTPQKVVEPGAAAEFGLSEKPTHYQALRTLANRLVGILHGCLRTHTLYDQHLAWQNEPDKCRDGASGEPHNVPEAPFDSTQSDLLDGKGPGPVIAVPQPAWAHADVHNVVIMSALNPVRVLSEVGLQTAITVDARRNVGNPLTLHGHLVVPPDDQRYLSKGGQIAKLPRTATRVEDQLASPRRGDANQCRLWCAVRPAGSYDR
jgi:hypothetical protein